MAFLSQQGSGSGCLLIAESEAAAIERARTLGAPEFMLVFECSAVDMAPALPFEGEVHTLLEWMDLVPSMEWRGCAVRAQHVERGSDMRRPDRMLN